MVFTMLALASLAHAFAVPKRRVSCGVPSSTSGGFYVFFLGTTLQGLAKGMML